MNSVKNFITILFLCIYTFSIAQNTDQVKKKGPADDYARSSISYLLLDFESDKYASYLTKAINTTSVPSKFDNNNLSKKIIKAPYYHGETGSLTSKNAEKVRRALVAENYAVDVVKYWWKVQNDGSYSTQLIQKRGLYNASDQDVSEVDATKVGRAKLADSGIKLIGNSYVLALDYYEVTTMEDEYDEIDRIAREKAKKDKTEFVPVKRVKNGFKGKLTAYLFKMNYTDTVQGYFDESFIDEKKLDVDKLNKIFNNVYSPVKLITISTVFVDGTQPNPGEFLAPSVQKTKDQLSVVMLNDGITKALSQIEKKIEAFRVKTPVTNVDPIRAKIGKKESLTHERRYFVWQYVENAGGNVVARKKGVLRARKVADNRNNELGNTNESVFYQIGGGKITEGMTLQERKDAGIGFAAGYGSTGVIIAGDINVGQWANMPVKQLKLYGDVMFGSKEYSNVVVVPLSTMLAEGNYSQLKYSIGILKEYPFARNFHAGWSVGYTGETITWTEDELGPNYDPDRSGEQLSATGFTWGLKFGMNLASPSVQLIGAISGHHYGNATYKSGITDEEDIQLETGWTDIFPDRSSIGFNLSLRINF